ncbi:MAG: hypothetical protein BWZ10_01777 [candidate division BRC1 bacterium ADurb.BinA364]|nr:MAG: hypothetical protein BWZ10_01777 [candidate division BRC1 bacterium ADurb.BinA364]
MDRPDSPFGIHIHATPAQAAMARDLGFKWARCHDAASALTKWYYVEPRPGEWKWQDEGVRVLRSHGLMILGTLDSSPPWASRASRIESPGAYREKCYAPTNPEAWETYCRTIVERYKGQIDHWEVWNEPYYLNFFSDVADGRKVHATPEQFAEIVERAIRAAREANPRATVLSSIGAVAAWTAGCVKAGAAEHADAFSHHVYTTQIPGGPRDILFEREQLWRAELPAEMRQRSSWNTEGGPGVQAHTFYRRLPLGAARTDARYLVDFCVRYYISTLSLGQPKFFLYSFHGHSGLGNPSFMLTCGDGTLLPLAQAISALAWHIEGKRYAGMAELAPQVWAYLFEGDGESAACLVNATGKPWKAPALPAGIALRDLCGNPLPAPGAAGPETCYLAGPSLEALEHALGVSRMR